MMVQLETLYINPEHHSAQRYRRTDRQMTLRCQ